ncbi:MAG: hypothetical protein FWG15_02865 [Propionibacteriaceae bacterium]|nr:hypothetical protein [Propionibacteriaceae bacterium]
MTEVFLSLTEVAELLGLTTGGLASQRLPEADARIGRARGWRRETIDAWVVSRPGRGRWGHGLRE